MSTEERVPRIKELKIRMKPDYYLELAREAFEKGNKKDALENYISYIENLAHPDEMKLAEQMNLTKLIMNLNNLSELNQEIEQEVLKCYLKVLNRYPQNAILLNAFGVFFFSHGEYTVARKFLQSSADLGYLPGEKNFLHVIWHLIPRWHFRMLNDQKRNESYKKAITNAINHGFKKVYDIGTGCGLLSLIATNCDKDVTVVAFEENKTLSDIASNIFKRNNVNENITLITRNSNMASVPPTPCNLILTEIFDAGVFGEDCLETIKHSMDNFLVEKNFKIIPAGVKLYVTGIESAEILRKHRYIHQLDELNLKDICIREVDAEPYDAEFLKNKNVKYLTNTNSFLEVNFYDKPQLEKLLESSDCIDTVELTCNEKGVLHAFAMWFDLCLDKEITISTDPSNLDNQCWEQAVFYLKHPIQVSAGEIVKIKPSMVNGQVHFEVVSKSINCSNCFEVSTEVISFLNDTQLIQSIINAADKYTAPDLRIVDFNIFPLFGLLMAKKGATVWHIYKDECDLSLFNEIMVRNDLPANKLICVHQKELQEYIIYVEQPHIVFTNIIKTDGSWNKEEFTVETEQIFKCESLPKKIVLNAQFISSKYLDVCNKVDDSNALNFEIFEEINKYSGSEHPNLETFEHEAHSTIAVFDISDLEKVDFHKEVDITSDGSCNGILYWFDIHFTSDENKFSTLNSTHYNKSCTLLNNRKCVKEGEKIPIHILRLEGHLKVYCDLN
ncbi:hypothetical protein Zmor_010404 [Zophobas morio]|uniref:Protein arginine N-methyltransferase domain-containing protein n=1 Tax=Zophobas morio TaxID=2755281 RepID=A0AA38IST7_9CUCU|nr:hypothetical protein Zmor_010404 [Zophobas morio]